MVKQIHLFFASIGKGELEAHAKIIHKGSKTAVGEVEVVSEKGKLVAKLIATYSIRRSDERRRRPTSGREVSHSCS